MTPAYLQIEWAHFQSIRVKGIGYLQIIWAEKKRMVVFAGPAIYFCSPLQVAKPHSQEINTTYANIII